MFCTRCGLRVEEGVRFCKNCGQEVGALPPADSMAVPATTSSVVVTVPVSLPYAGFWLRFVAYLIDSIVLGVILCILVGVGRKL